MGIESDFNAATFLTSSTSIELEAMPKRKLADRILDEIATLRRPRALMVETDAPSRQDEILNQSEPAAGPRPLLILE